MWRPLYEPAAARHCPSIAEVIVLSGWSVHAVLQSHGLAQPLAGRFLQPPMVGLVALGSQPWMPMHGDTPVLRETSQSVQHDLVSHAPATRHGAVGASAEKMQSLTVQVHSLPLSANF